MATPEHDPSRERRLRRAVAELSACAIGDIEAIWGSLSPAEREQLRPLLAVALQQMARGTLDSLDLCGTSAPRAEARPEDSAHTARCLARLSETLPNELVSRLLFGVDERMRDSIVSALPAGERPWPAGRSWRITARARTALWEAACAASQRLEEREEPTGAATPAAAPATWLQRVQRWIGRFA
jgi:hypothetical protein